MVKIKKYLSLLFLLIGIIFFISASLTFVNRTVFLFNSIDTDGVVVSVVNTVYEPGDGRKIPEKYPVIEFSYQNVYDYFQYELCF